MPDIVLIIFLPLAIFLVVFPALWIGVSSLLSFAGGWALLAERFKATEPAVGEAFRYASALFKRQGMFPVTYRGTLFITVGKEGIHLALHFLFRFLSPPLLIPWTAVESVTEQRHLFGSYGVITIRNCPVKILVLGYPGKRLQEIPVHLQTGTNHPPNDSGWS
jgi:hypothetical protein